VRLRVGQNRGVTDSLRVGYGYPAAFGLPIRLTWPLGPMTVQDLGIELRPPRLLPIARRIVVRASDVAGPVNPEGWMIRVPLKDGTWVKVGSPRTEDVAAALTRAGIPALLF
jgi:hypothetical protein